MIRSRGPQNLPLGGSTLQRAFLVSDPMADVRGRDEAGEELGWLHSPLLPALPPDDCSRVGNPCLGPLSPRPPVSPWGIQERLAPRILRGFTGSRSCGGRRTPCVSWPQKMLSLDCCRHSKSIATALSQ